MSETFASSIAELTPAWLTSSLRASGTLEADVEVDAADATTVGTGQMGACYRLELRYSGATRAPDRILAKLPSEDVGSREFAAQMGAYDREVKFYVQLAERAGLRVPGCYYAEAADDGKAFVLLLEDLAPAKQISQLDGCSPAQAAAALEQAARMHAATWRLHELRRWDWLKSGLGLFESFGANAGVINQGLRARYGDVLEPEYLEVGDRLASGGTLAWLEHLREPRCLWHCDFRLDNMLFMSDGEVAVVDWQSVALAQGTVDASYFIGAGLTTEDRRAHEEDLLRGYHAALESRGVTDYSWQDCWDDYRRNSVSGFLVAAVSSVSVVQTERGDQMFLAMLRRHGQQVLDHDALALLAA